jgi:hypothetical protein
MKNQNHANAARTQIADISVAGKELSEEHLRLVGGGLGYWKHYTTYVTSKTCVWKIAGECLDTKSDTKASDDASWVTIGRL